MKVINGIGAAKGASKAIAVIKQAVKVEVIRIKVDNVEQEINRFRSAQSRYEATLRLLYQDALLKYGEDVANIFTAYQSILKDEIFFQKIIKRVINHQENIDYAIEMEKQAICKIFASMDDVYMKERATDISNVCDELIALLNGKQRGTESLLLQQDYILIADDLTPANTIQLNKQFLKGFITEKGGITSHTVILAKSLGIPAIVGATGILTVAKQDDLVLMNGETGEATLSPSKEAEEKFEEILRFGSVKKEIYEQIQYKDAITLDGHGIKIEINSGDNDSISQFNAEVCDGIGLFRTEFLYMNHKNYPTEEDQFVVYRKVAEMAKGKEVVIRTLDIGGDKELAYMNLPKESNPFLGYRAIRICLDQKHIFLTQLRAILRASVFGNVKIMFPMIVNLEELRAAKDITYEAMTQLKQEGTPFNETIQIGIMIETPAAVLISDILAKESDFFSIGSNDLIQYMTATDRMNEKVQSLYDSCNISVLRAIQLVTINAKKAGIGVGICGEVASEDRLIPLWVAMGIDKLSMSPKLVGRAKYIIRRSSFQHLQTMLPNLLQLSIISDVKDVLDFELTNTDAFDCIDRKEIPREI